MFLCLGIRFVVVCDQSSEMFLVAIFDFSFLVFRHSQTFIRPRAY